MPFGFISNLDTTTFFLLMIIFILFVISMKKVFSIVVNAAWIAVASILFPVIMNRFFGFDIPIDRDSILSFVLLGLGLYFVYLVGKSIYKMLGVAERAAKKVPVPHIDRKPAAKEEKEEPERYEKRDRKREKELEEREKELQKREQQIRFSSALQTKKKVKRWDKDYVEIEDRQPKAAKQKSPHVTPLPVIEPKKKKNKD